MSVEVPLSLKRLVRLVVRGFYPIEHCLVVDLMIRKLSIKEEEIESLMKFEKKQLRSVLDFLKKEKLIKFKMRMETGLDGKTTKQTYYFINYKGFVNVIKYKLDLMRKKIETEERDSTKRSSFICGHCKKTFTDLEADQLYDVTTQEFRCSYCGEIVEEDPDVLPKPDSRLLIAKFNEQMEPLYILLKEVEDIKIPSDLLEPEPTEVNGSVSIANIDNFEGKWKVKDKSQFDSAMMKEATVKVEKDGETSEEVVKKEQPPWLAEITVYPSMSEVSIKKPDDRLNNHEPSPKNDVGFSKEVFETLLVHEKHDHASENALAGILPTQNHTSSNDWGNDHHSNTIREDDVTMNDDEDDDEDEEATQPLVRIGGKLISLHEVDDETILAMNQAEKDEYIRLTQEFYAHMYE